MEKKYLNKTMVDFVLEHPATTDYEWQLSNHLKYAYALSKTPRLGHFIPCDDKDVPLEKPIEYSGMDSDALYAVEQYQLACDRVLFEGFGIEKITNNLKYVKNRFVILFWQNLEEKKEWSLTHGIKTYENLVKYNLPLTDNGAKVFGYEKA